MTRFRVLIHGTPGKVGSFNPDATEGAIVGENLFVREDDGTLRLFDPTTDVIVNNVSSSQAAGSGGNLYNAPSGSDLDTDSVSEGVVNLYFTAARAVAAVAASFVGVLKFKGLTNCSANPNYPVGLKGDTYVVSVAGKIGGASGTSVDAGDWYVATADNAGGTEASVGASWGHVEHNLVGALLSANNLSDVASATTALANLAGAPLASPALTGTPTAPTASPGTNTTQLATTAFVTAAVAAVPAGGSSGQPVFVYFA